MSRLVLPEDLLDVARFLAPLLDRTAPGSAPAPSGARLPLENLLAALTCRARVEVVRSRIRCRSAVYVYWEPRWICRYVGSVVRESGAAVALRLGEHLTDPTTGTARERTWQVVTVLPVLPAAPEWMVRQCEGWAARCLGPVDGQAHPQVDVDTPPSDMARMLRDRGLAA